MLDLPNDVICNIAIYVIDFTLYSKCDQASDLWQLLELASEFESYIQNTADLGRKWIVDFNARKMQLVFFDQFNITGAIDMKIDGSAREGKPIFYDAGVNIIV